MPQPQQIGIYHVLETIRAEARTVYKVQGPGVKPLALKTAVKAELSADEVRRFEREAEVCSELDHRNLVQIFDSGEVDGILYQAMDLLEGTDLAAVYASGRVLTWPEKTSIMQQVCEGMEYAHALGLVHRNLQPANIFLENSGRVRILDFGKVHLSETATNSLNMMLVSQSYIAPELIQGAPCAAVSDVFSMGVIFYELCTGRHPFSHGIKSVPVVLDNIVNQTPPPIADAPTLDSVLQQALSKKPAMRPANAGGLRTLMAKAAAELQSIAKGASESKR